MWLFMWLQDLLKGMLNYLPTTKKKGSNHEVAGISSSRSWNDVNHNLITYQRIITVWSVVWHK